MEGFMLCLTKFSIYLGVCVAVLLTARLTMNIPQPVFRKMLHYVAMTAVPFMILFTDTWQPIVIIMSVLAVAAYPLLSLAERWSGFSHFFVEKRKGEIKRSLLDFCLPQIALTLIFYGWLDLPYVVAAGVLTWGVGDTFAALIGIKYGRHKVPFKHADRKKSWEGTIAGGISSFLTCLAVLLLASPLGPAKSLLLALITAPVSAAVELFTKNGNDTYTVPTANCILLALLSLI